MFISNVIGADSEFNNIMELTEQLSNDNSFVYSTVLLQLTVVTGRELMEATTMVLFERTNGL